MARVFQGVLVAATRSNRRVLRTDPLARMRRMTDVEAATVVQKVAESAGACSYILSKQVQKTTGFPGAGIWMDDAQQKTCQFWLRTLWLLTVPSPSI